MADFDSILALARQHLRDGRTRITRLRELIERRESDGHPTEVAEELLQAMTVSLGHMVEDLGHIERLQTIATRITRQIPNGDVAAE